MKRLVGLVVLASMVIGGAASSKTAFAKETETYPMKAAEFQRLVDARLARGRQKLEEHIKKESLDEAHAKAKRARFEARAAKVEAAAKQAEADGMVTAEEANAVREAGRRHARRHHRR